MTTSFAEQRLRARLLSLHGGPNGFGFDIPDAEQVCRELGIPVKKGMSILQKWVKQGKWDYGVSLRCGWFTEKGFRNG